MDMLNHSDEMKFVKTQKHDVIKFCIMLLICCSSLAVTSFSNAAVLNNHQPLLYINNSSTASSLNTFIYQVLESNPAIQAAKANVVAAQAQQRARAQPLYNPSITGEAQSAIDNTYSVGINQTVDWTNKSSTRAQIGYADVQVAEAQLADERQQLAAETLNALAEYQTDQGIVSLSKERIQLLQQFSALTEKRHENGDVARVDVDLAQLALSEAITQQASAEVNLTQALQKLREITGLKQANWPSFPTQLPKLQVTDDDMESLLYQLPTLQILNNQSLSAQERVQLAEKERYPDPTIGIQGGREEDSEGSDKLIGVSVSIPLFVRNNYHAEVDAANADAIEADQMRLNLIQQARADIEGSAERYQILYQTTQNWQQVAGEPLGDGMMLIDRLWQAGELNTTDYLVQLKQRVDSQIAGEELKGQAWQAWIAWLKASGQSDRDLYPTVEKE